MRHLLIMLVLLVSISFGFEYTGFDLEISPSYSFGVNTAPISLGLFTIGGFLGGGVDWFSAVVGVENISATASYSGLSGSGNTTWGSMKTKFAIAAKDASVFPLIVANGKIKFTAQNEEGAGGGGLGLGCGIALSNSAALETLAQYDAYSGVSAIGLHIGISGAIR